MKDSPQKSLRRIGLTGGIASGKSTVEAYLQSKGIPVIDADAVVHQLLHDDVELKAQIKASFGECVFNPDGTVNRPALGTVIFQDVAKRKLLESWIHPKTRDIMEVFMQAHADKPLAVASIPLLFESNLENRYDEVWLLETEPETQIERLMQSRGMSREDAEARIRNQMPCNEKRQRLQQLPKHALLSNHNSLEALFQQLDNLLA